jgi:hypothetical protein
MDQPVELIPLVCPQCSTPVPAEVDEVAWVCAQCGQGLSLDEEKGLVPLEVHYAAGIPANTRGKPFWIAEGQVSMQRDTYGSSGKDTKATQQFWSQPRRFFIPAFSAPLETLLGFGMQLLRQPPDLQAGSTAEFEPVILYLEDVKAAAEFIVVAIEAGRKDKVKQVEFTLQLSEPALWILPPFD